MSIDVTVTDGDAITVTVDGSTTTATITDSAAILVNVSDGSASSAGLICQDFAWGDASPVLLGILRAGKTLFRAGVNIDTAFNGTGAMLEIGTLSDPDAFLPAAYNDPTILAGFEAYPGVDYASDTAIYLSITPGSGASAGAGQVYLDFEPT